LQARTIAHTATPTCKGKLLPNLDEHHTPKCNRLKREIAALTLGVKWAANLQPQYLHREPPEFVLTEPDEVLK
jgi:hypothetical protein